MAIKASKSARRGLCKRLVAMLIRLASLPSLASWAFPRDRLKGTIGIAAPEARFELHCRATKEVLFLSLITWCSGTASTQSQVLHWCLGSPETWKWVAVTFSCSAPWLKVEGKIWVGHGRASGEQHAACNTMNLIIYDVSHISHAFIYNIYT